MADPTDTDEVDTPAPESDQERNWRKLENRTKTAEERVAQLERELAFTQAGLTHLSDKQVKALSAAHEGDYTAEALKATAEELGFGPKVEAGESTPAAPGPDHSSEVAELAALANSPNVADAPTGGPLTQEQIDQKISEAAASGGQDAVKEFMMANRHLFDF